MGYYKYYILNFQIAASVFDLHISFIYSPLPIFPAPAICCTSLFAVNANWVFEYVNFIIMHFTLSYVGVSILIGLLYRYYALQGNLSFFHSKKGVILITLFIIVYPIPTVIALVASVTSPEETRYYIQTEYSFYYETFINYCCHAISDPVSMIIYAIFAAIQITFIGSCSVITMFRINHMMKEKKLKLTKKTYDLHKQLIYSLWVQAFLPTCFLALPTVTAFVMIINAFGNLRGEFKDAFTMLILPSMQSPQSDGDEDGSHYYQAIDVAQFKQTILDQTARNSFLRPVYPPMMRNGSGFVGLNQSRQRSQQPHVTFLPNEYRTHADSSTDETPPTTPSSCSSSSGSVPAKEKKPKTVTLTEDVRREAKFPSGVASNSSTEDEGWASGNDQKIGELPDFCIPTVLG
uniref:G_PROTEIN_RECEP_F1_2 domain-containing protein n=1 Tax=Panagrellus redivivus TaxID=6233 RepID=A0A7E4VKI3_PANRE